MVDGYLSDEESVLAKFQGFHLTQDRVIKLFEGGGDTDYQDIQLEKITSFDYNKEFNLAVLILGSFFVLGGIFSLTRTAIPQPFPEIIMLSGFMLVLAAILSHDTEYIIHSTNPDVKLHLPESRETVTFWQRINQQKNHSK